ncbi:MULTISPECIES: hypothetical protein [Roseovarius]|uniref:hypothetical protein n=1 Tax=Roseovarius TaxID=74030 RepID=UPI001268768A|nr:MULTISPECIES: hypothetical protein [Roseovarius]MBY5988456.1 hypothetical protein [Roseovarius atlanticus]MBY6123847.1 hypothetical protein [Roseovarius atlanticus]MBY6148342.1 hypothetical protein [Roseovarius atlanticus]
MADPPAFGSKLFPKRDPISLGGGRFSAYPDVITGEMSTITMTYAAFAFSWMSVALFAAVLLA